MVVETFHVMLGLTMVSVSGDDGDRVMKFHSDNGRQFMFYHNQDCCECVSINDVIGDLTDLVGSPIIIAEEVSSAGAADVDCNYYSCTWTFYRFATVKGTVTVRWLGTSNGYYSEGVDFLEVIDDK